MIWIVAATTAAASAQPEPAVEEAERRFQNGVALYERHDYSAAYEEFRLAYDLTKRWELLFNLGVTAQHLARYRDAIDRLDQYLQEGGDRVSPERRAAVVAAEAEIRAVVAEVTVVVEGEPARVEVDGHAEGSSPLAEPLLLTSGTHVVVATRGTASEQKRIDVQSGHKLEVRLAPRAPVTTARLVVRTLPDRAALTLDGHGVGLAPWSGVVERGGHTLAASMPGRVNVSEEITVEAGQDRELSLDLPEPSRPWYKRWYVIAGLSAVVIAGGGAILYEETKVSGHEYSP